MKKKTADAKQPGGTVPSPSGKRVILGVTGASGAIYAERLLKALLEDGHGVELVISHYGARLLKEERDLRGDPRLLVQEICSRYGIELRARQVRTHAYGDLGASLASGSHPVHGDGDRAGEHAHSGGARLGERRSFKIFSSASANALRIGRWGLS